MKIELISVSEEHQSILKNLLQFYIYDFTEYVDIDIKESGLFPLHLNPDEFWTEKGKYAYIIKTDEKYAGFALVKTVLLPALHYSIAEFFILKKYRKQGIGKHAANHLFDQHRGDWEVHQTENNTPAQKFWIRVIEEYTGNNYSEHIADGKRIQTFSNAKRDT